MKDVKKIDCKTCDMQPKVCKQIPSINCPLYIEKLNKEQCKYFNNNWCKYPRLIFQYLCTYTIDNGCPLFKLKKEK